MNHKQATLSAHSALYLSSRVWRLVMSIERARTMALLAHPMWCAGFFLSKRTSLTPTAHLPSK